MFLFFNYFLKKDNCFVKNNKEKIKRNQFRIEKPFKIHEISIINNISNNEYYKIKKLLSLGIDFVLRESSNKEEIKNIKKFFTSNLSDYKNNDGYIAKFKKLINLESLIKLNLNDCNSKVKQYIHGWETFKFLNKTLIVSIPKMIDNFTIINSDKNLGVCIIENDLYFKQCYNHLLNNNFYEVISDKNIEENEIKIINNYKKMLRFLNNKTKILMNVKNDKLPSFCGLPKIHKNPWKIRPIIQAYASFTTNLAKHIHNILFQIHKKLEKFKFYWVVINTQQVIKTINRCNKNEGFKNDRENKFTRSYDFEGMYTNISHKDLIERLNWLFKFIINNELIIYKFKELNINGDYTQKEVVLTPINILILIETLLNWSYFKFEEKIFKQNIGIPMGANCSPLLANLYLASFEIEFFFNSKNQIQNAFLNSARYLDDLLLLANRFIDKININEVIYQGRLNLTESDKDSNNSTVFLDLKIRTNIYKIVKNIEVNNDNLYEINDFNNNKVYTYCLYSKNLNSYQFPHAFSFQPKGVKKSFIIGEFLRIWRNNSNINAIFWEINLLLKKLITRGYQEKEIIEIWKKYLNKKVLNTNNVSMKESYNWFAIKYSNLINTKLIENELNKNNNSKEPKIKISWKKRSPIVTRMNRLKNSREL